MKMKKRKNLNALTSTEYQQKRETISKTVQQKTRNRSLNKSPYTDNE